MADELDLFRLQADERAFLQDMRPWRPSTLIAPGCRRLDGARVVSLRHFASSTQARDALQSCGLQWPEATGSVELAGGDPLTAVLRRQPEELLLVETHTAHADTLLAALAPGRTRHAVAIDLSHGMLVLALQGAQLDLWLSHLVDAGAIPRRSRSATRTRMGDVAVVLMRLDPETVWLVADRSLAPYLADWLSFTHEAVFPTKAP